MNIAIATSDGINVDEHFGRAKSFHIFEVQQDTFNLEMVCHLDEPYSNEVPDHSFNDERFQKIATKLKGCKKVIVTKIGKAPAEALKNIGVEAVTYIGPISDIDL